MNPTSEHTPSPPLPTASTVQPDTPTTPSAPQLRLDAVFPGPGEMAERMRAMDWSQTPLGPVETWSPSLRMMVRFLLLNRFPLLLWWGPSFIQIYNDAYRPVLGTKHPKSLGQPVSECWAEIWDVIGPLIETPFNGGPATWMEDIFLEVNRTGFVEETHFTIAYSPVPDETAPNGIGGVLATVHEISEKVVGERRVLTLRDLGARSAEAKSAEEACRIAAEILAQHAKDIPFALLYLIDPDGQHARLAATAHVSQDDLPGSPVIALHAASASAAGGDMVWPLAEVVRSETLRVVDDLASRFAVVPAGPWSDPPTSAVVVPIRSNTAHQLAGLLVAGVSARLRLDDIYAGFYELVSSQIATAIANARAYEEERRRAEALAEIDRAKTIFFSNVSHEFRTPLTLMLGPLDDLLAREVTLSAAREELSLIHRNGLRLLKLVNTLLDFARIEAGRAEAVFAPTDVSAYTAELASSFRSLVEKAGMALVVDCPPLDGLLREPVYVDREMWEKIVLNLVSNAFKFTFAGEIRVALRPTAGGQHIALTVADTGTGIPPEELPHLFDRFHRVQGARSRSFEGSGIGLALVQELTHLHGGSITVESRLGQGTAFTVTLPTGTAHLPHDRLQSQRSAASTAIGAASYVEEARRWLPDAPEAGDADGTVDPAALAAWLREDITTAVPDAPPLPDARQAHILLADDNADLRDYLRRLLSERYTVEVVPNGVAALAAVRERPPDLVLSDVMMPELDGFGLLRALRGNSRTRAIPVILLSARAGEEATIEGLEAGADDYLIKPFSAREVLARVASHLEMARLKREAAERASALESVIQSMTDGVVVYGPAGDIKLMNAAYRKLLALDDDALLRPIEQRGEAIAPRDPATGRSLPPEAWPSLRLLRGESLTGAQSQDVLVRAHDGREVLVNCAGAPVRDERGTVEGAVMVIRDVAERRYLEQRTHDVLDALLAMAEVLVSSHEADAPASGQELEPAPASGPALPVAQRLAELTRGLLNCSRVSITAVEGEQLLTSPVAVVGLSPEQEVLWWEEQRARSGRQLGAGMRPADLQRLLAGEAVTFDLTRPPYEYPNPYGVTVVLAAPMTVQGRTIGLLALDFQDTAEGLHVFTPEELQIATAVARLGALALERDRLQREHAQALAREIALAEANRRMDEFLGIASHELRTPLTSVTANVQMAERQLGTLAHRDGTRQGDHGTRTEPKIVQAALLLQRTSRQVQRLDRLVGDLLDASRIQAGKLDLRLESCDLLAIAREAAEAQRAAWPDRSIALDLPRRDAILLEADPDRVGQVITNFLTNALKYSAPSAPVALRVRTPAHEQKVRVGVRDYGPGLSTEQQEHLFERFYRVPGIEQQSGSGIGLGLGLHICKTIVERHGGAVGVESVPGEGSTFWFTLPLAAPTC